MVTRWSGVKAQTWYEQRNPIRGCNYLPRTAVNTTEFWQASSFDPETISEELVWAQRAGYNSVRVFVQFLVWQQDARGLKQHMDHFLQIADAHGLSTMFVLFDDCAFADKEPYLGPQDDPIPGVHNSGWTPSPGLKRVTDIETWQPLEAYIKDIVTTFADDGRVLIWDLYNEPGNSQLHEKSIPLVEAAFRWARAANPQQPLTSGAWGPDAELSDLMSERLFELSDIVSFHYYKNEGLERAIERCKTFGRPVICTEWLHRRFGQTADRVLPLFSREHIGWYNWGLVAGRTQTYLDWRPEENTGNLTVWQHDILRADGTPYDAGEIEQFKSFAFAK